MGRGMLWRIDAGDAVGDTSTPPPLRCLKYININRHGPARGGGGGGVTKSLRKDISPLNSNLAKFALSLFTGFLLRHSRQKTKPGHLPNIPRGDEGCDFMFVAPTHGSTASRAKSETNGRVGTRVKMSVTSHNKG